MKHSWVKLYSPTIPHVTQPYNAPNCIGIHWPSLQCHGECMVKSMFEQPWACGTHIGLQAAPLQPLTAASHYTAASPGVSWL